MSTHATPTEPDDSSARRRVVWCFFLIGVVTMAAYAPALGAGFIWDDDAYVEDNATLRTARGLADIWISPSATPQYYPLVHTTFWLEYRLWGLHPFGYHLVNVLLHLGSVVLLYRLLLRLAVPGALLAAAVFALHPVMVESVAWVTERKNVLSMVFYLGSALVYMRGRWGAAFALFLCALASKSVTFSLPFALLLVLYWRRGCVHWRDVRPLLPFVVAGVLYGALTSYLEHTQVGAYGPEFERTVAERLLVAGRTPWFYLSKLLWPHPLVFIYEKWDVDPAQLWQWAFPGATVALVGALFALRRRLGRGPLVAVLLFGGTLFPALGFITVFPFRYAWVADHFQYHASLAIFVGVCATLARWVPARVGVPCAVAVLGLYACKTWSQCGKYRDRETLYRSILADVPDSWFAHNNLGAILVTRGGERGDLDEVQRGYELYRRAKELNPKLWPGPGIPPEAYAQCMTGKMLGNVIKPELQGLLVGERLSAADVAQRLAALEPRLERVVARFEAAIRRHPDYADALRDCAKLYAAWGVATPDPGAGGRRLLTSARMLDRALALDPSDRETRARAFDVHMRLAAGMRSLGRPDEARAHEAAAQRLREGR